MVFLIKECRQACSMSQTELAERSGVSRQLICNLEKGNVRSTSTNVLELLAKVMGVKVGELLGED